MPQTHLTYELQLSQSTSNGVSTSLTYVNTGQESTVQVVVSNRGADVTIESLTFDFGAFGQDGTDLVAAASDITPIAPSGWQCVTGTSFTIVPTSGSAVIGTSSITFTFGIAVNAATGACSLAITEVSSAGTAHVYPMPITKMPAAFMLASFSAAPTVVNPASPMLVEPGGTVTLSWDCAPGQEYTIGFPGGGSQTVTGLSGGTASLVTPAVLGTSPTVAYTVCASAQSVSGQALSVELSSTLNVDVAQIISFAQPGAFYASPVTLNWQTSNADYCVLYGNGVIVDPHAPTNPGVSGYQTTPVVQSTQYVLEAYRHQTPVSSPIVTVTLYDWAQTNAVSVANADAMMALAVSRSGSVLYYAGNYSVTAYDTASLAILGTGVINPPPSGPPGPIANGVSNSGLVLSPNGMTLYAGIVGAQVLVFQTSNLAAAPVTIPVTGGPLAMSPNGATLYVATSEWGSVAGGTVYAVSTATHAVIKQVSLTAPGHGSQPYGSMYDIGDAVDMKLSPDGATLYVLISGADQGNCPLYTIDTATFVATQVASAVGMPMALTFDGATLYCGANVGEGGTTTTVKAITIPGFSSTNVVTPVPLQPLNSTYSQANINGIGTDHSGGLFVSVCLSSDYVAGQPYGTTLFLVDPVTGTSSQMTNVAYDAPPAFAVNDADDAAYFTNGEQIVVLSSNGGGA